MDEEPHDQPSLANATPPANNDNSTLTEPGNENPANASVGPSEATEAEEIPSLDTLSKEPYRTHRKWFPKYGRVQKCDWCNARAPGTLHVCVQCSIRMCEDCARNRLWHRNRTHFIDADTLDWVMKKIPRAPRPKLPKQPKSTKLKVPSKRSAAPDSPDQRPRTLPAARRVKFEDEDEDEDEEDDGDWAGHGNNFDRARTSQPHFNASVHPHYGYGHPHHQQMPNYYDYNQEALRYQQAVAHGGYAPYGRPEPPLPGYHDPRVPPPAAPSTTDFGTRRGGRQAAAKARQSISEQSRRDDDDASETGVDDELGPRHHQDDSEVHKEKSNKNRRRSDQDTGSVSQSSTERGRASTIHVGAAQGNRMSVGPPEISAREREHDRLIVDVYNWAYGNKPSLNPHRVRTHIPDRWFGPREALVPPYYPREPGPYGHGPNPPLHPAYPHGQYHVKNQHQHLYAPPGYSYPAHQQPYQEYHQYPIHPQYPPPHGHATNTTNTTTTTTHPSTAPASAPAPATATTRPAAPVHHQHQLPPQQPHASAADRMLLEEMCRAWTHNAVLQRLVASNHRVYAIQLLWDVCELRRRVAFGVGDDHQGNTGGGEGGGVGGVVGDAAAYASSQTVRWFVAERDSQFRLEYEQNQRVARGREREREWEAEEARAREQERELEQEQERGQERALPTRSSGGGPSSVSGQQRVHRHRRRGSVVSSGAAAGSEQDAMEDGEETESEE
ncbi:predicted protein [Chaetomium globosum CBS 148.51]|uniref:Uncharacterized protein n=1 Tax=Chaetomium globosum (strain ATCC 6205 / CBS 148.51 / DSM 1962 / NBRC 6347 / NRRL 1970) TaxID=306901 RepID=Q2HGA3_CHAGB|nr:uncharacterized protein CHGG_00751 [Chaetomium globosum CBS 148.51]EAQ92516.1 predicted protein [Chaetomium globosum CBS 148.51]